MSILNMVGNEVGDNILKDAGLDWTVDLTEGIYAKTNYGTEAADSTRSATVRTDTNQILGIVSPSYKVVQNTELVHMAQRVADKNKLTVTSAGAMGVGERVWLAIEAESFYVGKSDKDEVKPYLLLTNGHDGRHSLAGTPTSVRPWCENTLNLALREGRRENMCISIRHKGNMQDKIEALTETLAEFYDRTRTFKSQSRYLAGTEINNTKVVEYFDHVYSKHVGEIHKDPQTSAEDRARNKHRSTIMKWCDVYDRESSDLGSNMWVAFNAVTNWIDHGRTFRGEKKLENKFNANFFGSAADKKQAVLETTLKFA